MLQCQRPSVRLSVCDGSALGRGACREEGRDHRQEEERDHLALCLPLQGPLVSRYSALHPTQQGLLTVHKLIHCPAFRDFLGSHHPMPALERCVCQPVNRNQSGNGKLALHEIWCGYHISDRKLSDSSVNSNLLCGTNSTRTGESKVTFGRVPTLVTWPTPVSYTHLTLPTILRV